MQKHIKNGNAAAAPDLTKLVASNLPHNIGFKELEDIFGDHRLVKYSLRRNYALQTATALLTFETAAKARNAKEHLNFLPISDKEMLLANFDPAMVANGVGNLFVKGFPSAMTNKDLYNFFKPYGEIFSCKVAKDSLNKSKRYGYIHYMDPGSAARLIQEQSALLDHFPALIIQEYKRNGRQQAQFRNVYVKHLPQSITKEPELRELFAPCGKIISVVLHTCTIIEKRAYFGFVCFENAEDAKRAVRTMNGKDIEGRTLYVCKSLTISQRQVEKRAEAAQSRKQWALKCIFVRMQSQRALDERILRQQFAKYSVKKVCVFRGGKGRTGAVEFEDEDTVSTVLAEYSGPLHIARMRFINHDKAVTRRVWRAENMYYLLLSVGQKRFVELEEPREYKWQWNPLQEEQITSRNHC